MYSNSTFFLILSLTVAPILAMEQQDAITLDPLGDGKSSLELLRFSGSDLDIVNAARVSYGKQSEAFSEADQRILTMLITSGHETPFEQTLLQYRVKLPIFVARQWMRHRVGVSYNELSARYTHMKDEFYIPTQWRNKSSYYHGLGEKEREATDSVIRANYTKALEEASKAYESILAVGVPRELARGVLPVSLYTNFVFACNMRSLFHFIELRADSNAQWEIQQYAKDMLKLAQPHFPVSIDIWSKKHNIKWLNEKPSEGKPLEEKQPAETH